jgi:hypothetical protein
MAILKDVLRDPDPDGQVGGSGSDGGTDAVVIEELVVEETVTESSYDSADE